MIFIILFAYIIFFLAPPIIGLILSIIGMRKYKSGINIAGLSLNIVALSLQIIRIFIIIFIYGGI